MTYKEYQTKLSAYQHAISMRKSLLMTIQMNKIWLLNPNSPKGKKRLAKVNQAKKDLSQLVIPDKPTQPIGYELIVDGGFEGFFNSDNKEEVYQQALEYLKTVDDFNVWELIPKPRYAD